MGKKLWVTLAIVIIVLIIGWFLISPAFVVEERNDDSPLIIRDSMSTMTDEQKAEFEEVVDSMRDQITEMSDSMPSSAELLFEGSFKPRAHDVKGQALLIQEGNKKILRFENFETINGPNLHIYLASDLSDSDIIDLGTIKATKGNVNYEIPDGIDTNKYNIVLVWCVPFRVLFSYAELQ